MLCSAANSGRGPARLDAIRAERQPHQPQQRRDDDGADDDGEGVDREGADAHESTGKLPRGSRV